MRRPSILTARPLRTVLRLLLAGWLLGAGTTLLAAGPATETEVKAAYLYNFAKFIHWPDSAFSDAQSPLRICVAGDTELLGILQKILQDKQIDNREVRAQALNRLDNSIASCQILYHLSASGIDARSLLARTRQLPVVTIGDNGEFLDLGGMIAFVIVDQRVRFELDLAAIRQADIQLSSRLMGVAYKVREAP